MNRGPRNHQLLQQIGNNQFKNEVARAFDIASDYEKDVEAVALDRRLSPDGKKEKAQGHLRQALRDLRDLRQPIEEYHSKTESMRAAAKLPTFDKTDIVAAMNRRELRDRSFAMTPGQRAGLMTGKTRSVAFLDAILEFADDPWMAGINIHDPGEREIFEAAREERSRDLNGPLLDTIAARESVESEALMVVNVVRADLAADSGLESREFEAEAKAAESGVNAVRLKRSTDANGHEVIYELVPEGGGFRGRIASPDAVRNGHFFQNYEEYLASRAA